MKLIDIIIIICFEHVYIYAQKIKTQAIICAHK